MSTSGQAYSNHIKAQLQPISAIEPLFSRIIIIDIVGPLCCTKIGNKYILTVTDLARKFPEAIPLQTYPHQQ